jgi:RNA 2',3'-cyclic 3'-phosphodiesterase
VLRCFVAVVPPLAATLALAARVLHARAAWPQLGWVSPDRWHLTLAFLGEVDDEAVARLDRPLREVASHHRPMTLAVDGVGTFPATGRPRVLWAGITGAVDTLYQLAREVVRATRAESEHRDTKPFRAHLTLARSRRTPIDDPAPLLAELAGGPGPEFTATEVVLMRSVLGPGARYDELAHYPLRS